VPDDRPLAIRQADQLRVEIAALEDGIELVMAQLARLPTRVEMTRLVLLSTAAGAVIVCLVMLLIR
jgi:hypothetical protein